jgi:hypothetical protein
LNKHIRENLSNFGVPQIRTVSKKRSNLSLAKKVEAKVVDFDIKEAVKLLSSDDSLSSLNEDITEELKKKHLSPSRELFFPDAFIPGDFSLIVNEQNVREAINSFPSEICNLLYGASLCVLHKKDGGIRPIAIGNCLRRLTSKLAPKPWQSSS